MSDDKVIGGSGFKKNTLLFLFIYLVFGRTQLMMLKEHSWLYLHSGITPDSTRGTP